MDENKIKQIINEHFEALIKSDRIVIEKSRLQLLDGRHIQVGLTTGTKIATATTQKLGFFNATPVIQRTDMVALTDDTTGTADNTVANVGGSFNQATLNNNFADLTAKINSLRTALRYLGLMA